MQLGTSIFKTNKITKTNYDERMWYFGEKLKTNEVFDIYIIQYTFVYYYVLLHGHENNYIMIYNVLYSQNMFFDRIRVIYSLEIKVTTSVRLSPQRRNDKQSIRNENPAVGH